MLNKIIMLQKTSLPFVLCLFFLVAPGCQRSKVPGLVPAEGVVLYNGVPLAGATIMFVPQNEVAGSRMASAGTDMQGHFSLQTLGEKGVLPNDYKVTLTKYVKNEGPKTVQNWKKQRSEGVPEEVQNGGPMDVVSVIPAKLTDPRKTDLTFSIGQEGNRTIRVEFND